jgi:two-component system chemotaxis response regulator CheB
MSTIRTLIIDDSVVIRKLVTQMLESDPTISVVAAAASGQIGLARLQQFDVDVVILDLEMPDLDGLATLQAIRQNNPQVPVLIFSSLSERGAVITLDALALGANDYLHKPLATGGTRSSLDSIREELIYRVKMLARLNRPHRPVLEASTAALRAARILPPAESEPSVRRSTLQSGSTLSDCRYVEIVAIGISTGGPPALLDLLPEFPEDFPVPILIVQHMPAPFLSLFAQRLDRICSLRVREAESGIVPKPGEVWLAPGDHHLEVSKIADVPTLQISQTPLENSCRPSVDPLFRSVAACYGANSLGVVMTGMGRDGLEGARAIKRAGGQILIQDEASSVVWGMPGYVALESLADREVSLDSMAQAIRNRVALRGISSLRAKNSPPTS